MTEREINYLGALLHDVGKFKWRSQTVKAGDDHEKLGEEFIREYLGKVECLKNDIEKIVKAANRESGKIWLADITGAQEREGIEDKTPRRPLASIFQRVTNVKHSNCKPNEFFYSYLPGKLNMEIDFPKHESKKLSECKFDDDVMISKHQVLWKEFISEIPKLSSSRNFKSFLRSFYSLLEKYTSKVLSAGYLSYPDISLFDHSRVVAALSICMEETDSKENKECILFQGDVSGIQNYLYDEVYKIDKAAKRLRGRSFYVSLLTDVVSNYVLDELNLFKPNLLYNGGGHFIMLIPNSENNKEKLKDIEKYINEKLFIKYSGNLQFVIGYLEENSKEVMINFDNVYKKLSDTMSDNKKKKSYSILKDLFANPIDFRKVNVRENTLADEEEKIGQLLPRSNYIFEFKSESDLSEIKSTFNTIDFNDFNYSYILSDDKVNKSNVENIISNLNKLGAEECNVYKINDTDCIYEDLLRKSTFPLSMNFRFIGSYAPVRDKKNYEVMSFEELGKMNSENYPMLGIARMDLDSLGAVFAFGLKEETPDERKYTISRIASLSRELEHFFCGHINSIAEQNNIYIAYSGGDDVFAVGSWVNIICFIQQIKQEFTKFACENPNLTISCGVAFTKPNFPIASSAKISGNEEKKAKDEDIVMKDKASVFSTVVGWKEFDDLICFGNGLFKIIDDKNADQQNKLPRSFIHSLLSMTKECFDKKGKIKLNKVYKASSRLHYLFGRRKITEEGIQKYESESKDDLKRNFKTELAIRFIKSQNPEIFYKHFNIPASYVIYKTRN